jgi:adenylate kinase family enzyme
MKILVIGEAGRGKTTLATKLSIKLGIPVFSTDDFYWAQKFSIPADKVVSVEKIQQVYAGETWIVEGTTAHLLVPGFELADKIIYIGFNTVWSQWRALIRRSFGRPGENWWQLAKLMKHVLYKRRNWAGRMSLLTQLEPYFAKTLVCNEAQSTDEDLRMSLKFLQS